MIKITKARSIGVEIWENLFTGKSNQERGLLFEKMIGTVLDHMFGPEHWENTKISHDHGRDYEKTVDGATYWAECKAYTENLSYHILSPNLIMARLHQVKALLIFSVSPLNANAIPVLARFQQNGSETLYCFDGNNLDQLLIADGKLFHSIFGPDIEIPPPLIPFCEVYVSVTADSWHPPSGSDFFNITPVERKVTIEAKRNEIVRVDLVLRQIGGQKAQPVTISLKNAHQNDFEVQFLEEKPLTEELPQQQVTGSITLNLGASGLSHCLMLCRPLFSGETRPLPQLQLTTEFGNAPSLAAVTANVKVSGLYQIGLVGKRANEIVDAVVSSLTSRRSRHLWVVKGTSGVGKSRLLEEITNHSAPSRYSAVPFDLEYGTENHLFLVAQNILLALYGLPGISQIEDSPTEQWTCWADEDLPEELEQLKAFFIQKETSHGLWEGAENAIERALQAAADRRILLIIDNLQYASDELIEFLETLWSHAEKSSQSRLQCVFSYNVDMENPISSAAHFLEVLEAAALKPREVVRVENVPPFGTDDVSDFIKKCISGNETQERLSGIYREVVELIQTKVEPKPLNLWQTMFYLMDEGILDWREDRMVMKDLKMASLPIHLNDLPRDLHTLLNARWEINLRLSQTIFGPSGPQSLKSTVMAGFVLHNAHEGDWVRLGAKESLIERLVQAGILIRETGGFVRFIHQQLFYFFRSAVLDFSEGIGRNLLGHLRLDGEDANRYQQYFILSQQFGHADEVLLEQTISSAQRQGLSEEYGKLFSEKLSTALFASKVLNTITLQGYSIAGDGLLRWSTLHDGVDVYYKANSLITNAQVGEDISFALIDFYLKGVAAHLAVKQDNLALEWINVAERVLDANAVGEQGLIDENRATILYRKSSLEKNFSQFDQAEEDCRQALEIFTRLQKPTMVLKAQLDLSEIASARGDTEQCLDWLRIGVKFYEANPDAITSPSPARYHLSRARLALAEKKFDDAISAAAEGTRYCVNIREHFWEAHCRLVQLATQVLSLDHHSSRQKNRLREDLVEAEGRALAFGTERTQSLLEYMRGKILLVLDEPVKAKEAFTRCFSILAKQNPEYRQMKRREANLIDIAMTCRAYGINLSDEELSLINRRPPESLLERYESKSQIIQNLGGILDLPNASFDEVFRRWVHSAMFNNGEIAIVMP